jgi:hypothetical protein
MRFYELFRVVAGFGLSDVFWQPPPQLNAVVRGAADKTASLMR